MAPCCVALSAFSDRAGRMGRVGRHDCVLRLSDMDGALHVWHSDAVSLHKCGGLRRARESFQAYIGPVTAKLRPCLEKTISERASLPAIRNEEQSNPCTQQLIQLGRTEGKDPPENSQARLAGSLQCFGLRSTELRPQAELQEAARTKNVQPAVVASSRH